VFTEGLKTTFVKGSYLLSLRKLGPIYKIKDEDCPVLPEI